MFEIGDRVNLIEFDKEAIVVGVNDGLITVEFWREKNEFNQQSVIINLEIELSQIRLSGDVAELPQVRLSSDVASLISSF